MRALVSTEHVFLLTLLSPIRHDSTFLSNVRLVGDVINIIYTGCVIELQVKFRNSIDSPIDRSACDAACPQGTANWAELMR